MKKIVSLLLFGLILVNVQAFCAEKNAVTNSASKEAASIDKQNEDIVNDLEVNDNMFTITDEQFQEAKNTPVLPEEKMDFRTRVINSGYFTTESPSRTYVRLRDENKENN